MFSRGRFSVSWVPTARARPRPLMCCWDLSRQRAARSEEHTSELQSPCNLVCRLLLEKKNTDVNLSPSIRTTQPVEDHFPHRERNSTPAVRHTYALLILPTLMPHLYQYRLPCQFNGIA